MRFQLEGQDTDGRWCWSNISADGVKAHTLFDTEEEAEAARAELNAIYAYNDPDYDPEGIRVIERPNRVSRAEIHDKIRQAYLASLSHLRWHYVWVGTDGSTNHDIDASPRQFISELEGVLPRAVIVWAREGAEVMPADQIELQRDSDDWDAWFETNVYELEEKLEPTGLELVD